MKEVKIIGEVGGILGALMIATNTDVSAFGFIAFTISSVAWTFAAWKMKEYQLMRMSIVFTAINILGMYRWFT